MLSNPSVPSVAESASPGPSPLPVFQGPRHRIRTLLALLATTVVLLPWVFDIPSIWGGILNGTEINVLRYHIDFHVYREGALALLAGDNIYLRDYEVRGIVLPFTYPPLGAILFTPLTLLPMMPGAAVWALITVVLLWWCMVIVLRRALPQLGTVDHRILATWALPVALLFEPVRETLSFGQINVLLMLLVLLDTLGRQSRLPRGILIGLAAAIKLTPAVFILYFLVRRDWKGAATTVASGVFFTLLAFALNPTISWTYWLDTLQNTDRIGGLAYTANQSFQGMLFRVLPESSVGPAWLVLVILGLVGIIAAMLRVQGAASSAETSALGLVMLNSLVALVCSPVSWSHHWVWLVPVALLCAVTLWRSWDRDPLTRRVAGGMTLLSISCVLLQPHWSLPNTREQELDWSWWVQPWGNSYLIIAIFLVISALLLPRLLPPQEETQTGAGHIDNPLARGWSFLLLPVAVVMSIGSVVLIF
ncbi:Polyprenol-phosphate-mannose-dependent alpha-(1-2)-phosphatidylinositol mannoside mannosyltransferase [Corynebacterium occultum]|uniref:Polyprenol-phosphate-mannose-dependent alpha-(1-2)-phosphatidylinositol mannoside mannosyltransferase n=1 Tax=Corynebacterium occultum TaxID=2675219 RepID=A0A6B8WL56_9CORY|nr:glycosyltransferase 87 family protein [Corynebacterium occultum]QGU07148.1 Polyprenol-phosphate-mannose-dependent alpha-(1-2)-phosphatidylinositol mannoside mannosyltransferase [Corynebacterium occultum]